MCIESSIFLLYFVFIALFICPMMIIKFVIVFPSCFTNYFEKNVCMQIWFLQKSTQDSMFYIYQFQKYFKKIYLLKLKICFIPLMVDVTYFDITILFKNYLN